MARSAKAMALQRVSTVAALSRAIREQILDGSLVAGSALREAELAADFGVSRHTVRTALLALVHEGLATHEPNRGIYVPRLASDDVIDLFRLRAILEVAAVAAMIGQPRRSLEATAAVEKLRNLEPDTPWTQVRDADLDFHAALVAGLDSPRSAHVHSGLLVEMRLCFLELREELESAQDVVRQHTEIMAAIEREDLAAASDLLTVHLEDARNAIVAAYAARD
jgi:DNA-binding GntR family transcriptional regulator